MASKQTKQQTESKRERGRPYTPRPCVGCKREASIAVQVMGRSVGLGQGRRTRQVKLSTTVLFCDLCAVNPTVVVKPLLNAAGESVGYVREHRAAA